MEPIVRRRDLLLAGALVMAAVCVLLLLWVTRSTGATVRVTVDGTEYGRWPLDTDAVIPIETDGGYNLLVIRDGAAVMEEADCPRGLCTHHAPIRYDGQSILCLPHRVSAEILGGEAGRVDAITG